MPPIRNQRFTSAPTFVRENADLSDDEDEDFMQLALLVTFPRKKKTFLQRSDHFQKWRDEQFFARFRLSKSTVKFILEQIEDRIASPTTRNNAVSPEDKLFITLRYYATGSFLAVCSDFVGIHKSTASGIIRMVSREIALLKSKFINFPSTQAEIDEVRQGFYNIAKFPKCIGAIDCTHVRIKSPGGTDAEIYRNRKGYFSFNVQTICDAKLQIQNIVARWPGSAHDSTIFNQSNIRGKFERRELGDNIILADSGYPLREYMMTPFGNPSSEGEQIFNESQIRTRNTVERSYGVWKKRFPVLALGIQLDVDVVESLVVACAVLHNIACHFGENTPRVSRVLEKLIDLSTFTTGSGAQVGGLDRGQYKRNSLVRYFESL